MTAQDVLNAAKGKPVLFEANGVSAYLRPLSFDDRQTVFGWHEAGRGGQELMVWLNRRHLSDESGVRVLSDDSPVGEFDVVFMEAVAEEVLRRAGLRGDAGKV